MDNLTKLVRDEITRQYRSVRQFAFAVDIPLSTINSALHNGVGGSSFDTVMRICKILGIKPMSNDAALYLTDDTEKLLTQYAKLTALKPGTATVTAKAKNGTATCDLAVTVTEATGKKCPRCWMHSTQADEHDLCPRCAAVCKALDIVFD